MSGLHGMTPLDPGTVRESFALIRALTPDVVHELICTLESRLILDESLLALQARLDDVRDRLMVGGDLVPFPGHSVKVGDAS